MIKARFKGSSVGAETWISWCSLVRRCGMQRIRTCRPHPLDPWPQTRRVCWILGRTPTDFVSRFRRNNQSSACWHQLELFCQSLAESRIQRSYLRSPEMLVCLAEIRENRSARKRELSQKAFFPGRKRLFPVSNRNEKHCIVGMKHDVHVLEIVIKAYWSYHAKVENPSKA